MGLALGQPSGFDQPQPFAFYDDNNVPRLRSRQTSSSNNPPLLVGAILCRLQLGKVMPTPAKGPPDSGARARTADAGEPRHSTIRARHITTTQQAKASGCSHWPNVSSRSQSVGICMPAVACATVVHNKDVVHELFTDRRDMRTATVGTRASQIGSLTKGDNAPMARIELLSR